MSASEDVPALNAALSQAYRLRWHLHRLIDRLDRASAPALQALLDEVGGGLDRLAEPVAAWVAALGGMPASAEAYAMGLRLGDEEDSHAAVLAFLEQVQAAPEGARPDFEALMPQMAEMLRPLDGAAGREDALDALAGAHLELDRLARRLDSPALELVQALVGTVAEGRLAVDRLDLGPVAPIGPEELPLPETFEAWIDDLFRAGGSGLLAAIAPTPAPGEPYAVPLADQIRAVEWVTRLLAECDTVLAELSDFQVGHGLWRLNHDTDDLYPICGEQVPWPLRRDCLRAMPLLFERCFASRLEHSTSQALATACFMWCEVNPTPWSGTGSIAGDDELLAALETILGLDSRPCRMAALHGLGHLCFYLEGEGRPGLVELIIDRFLAAHDDLDDELREYALSARDGMVQ